MARNYKRDRRGRFARVAGRAGRAYVRGKSRRVDRRKATRARIKNSGVATRGRQAVAVSRRISTNKKLNRAVNITGAAIEIGGPLLGAAGIGIGRRARSQRSNRAAASRFTALAAKSAKVPYAKVNRKGVYRITGL
jgi:hypothetical protein